MDLCRFPRFGMGNAWNEHIEAPNHCEGLHPAKKRLLRCNQCVLIELTCSDQHSFFPGNIVS